MSGRAGSHRNVVVPTGVLAPPGRASTTMENPFPDGRSKTSVPSGSTPDGITSWSSDRVTPKKVITGSGGTVLVGVAVIVGVRVTVRVCVTVGVRLGVRVTVAVRV